MSGRYIGVLLCGCVVAAFPIRSVLAVEAPRVVVLSYRVTNDDPAVTPDVKLRALLPVSNRYQNILDIQLDPAPVKTETDLEGQKIVTVSIGDLAPRETKVFRAVVTMVPLPAAQPAPVSAKSARKPELPPLERVECLADSLALDLRAVRTFAADIVKKSTTDVGRVRDLERAFTQRFTLAPERTHHAAPVVLTRKKACPSELAYTLVACCRALRMPARLVGGYLNYAPVPGSANTTPYVWAEVFTKESGWISVDFVPGAEGSRPGPLNNGYHEARWLTFLDTGAELDVGARGGWQLATVKSSVPGQMLHVRTWALFSSQQNAETTGPAQLRDFLHALHAPTGAQRAAIVASWTADHPSSAVFGVEMLLDADVVVRRAAADLLARAQAPLAVNPLAEAYLSEMSPETRAVMYETLRQLVNTVYPTRRSLAVWEICRTPHPVLLPLLDGVWFARSRNARQAAAESLWAFGPRPDIAAAYDLLASDWDPCVSFSAALQWARLSENQLDACALSLWETQNVRCSWIIAMDPHALFINALN